MIWQQSQREGSSPRFLVLFSFLYLLQAWRTLWKETPLQRTLFVPLACSRATDRTPFLPLQGLLANPRNSLWRDPSFATWEKDCLFLPNPPPPPPPPKINNEVFSLLIDLPFNGRFFLPVQVQATGRLRRFQGSFFLRIWVLKEWSRFPPLGPPSLLCGRFLLGGLTLLAAGMNLLYSGSCRAPLGRSN